MNEERIDALIREAADEYNAPPVPPREAMWAAIREERRRRDAARRNHGVRPWHWGIGMAAMLAIGIGLGRITLRQPYTGQVETLATADGPATTQPALPYRLAATQHLSRTEAFLTSYQSGIRGEASARELSAWAAELLTGTRLLLDSPAAEDPRLAQLLLDLELVLAQIARLSATGDPDGEAQIIEEALTGRDTLSRLRAVVPAGPPVSGT